MEDVGHGVHNGIEESINVLDISPLSPMMASL
jgi:hypothetical protein